MNTLTISRQKKRKRNVVTSCYDITADAKNRISLRGATSKYFYVKAFSNGCYVLEPRILVKPASISERLLKMIDHQLLI